MSKPHITNLDKRFFLDYIKQIKEVVRDSRFKLNEQKRKEKQLAEELDILRDTTLVCQVDKITSELPLIDFKSIGLAASQFYNPEVMAYIACLTSSIYYLPKNGNQKQIDEIHSYIKDLKLVSSGAYGNISLAKIKDLDIIIKAPKRVEDDDLPHEYFVGMHALNNLRKDIPNFVYVYGGFSCSKPIISDEDDKKIINWCTTDKDSVGYVIYENIVPSISLYDFIEKSDFSFETLLSLYLQVLLSLNLANEKYQFTHYDLHPNNIIIRFVEGHEQIEIPYSF